VFIVHEYYALPLNVGRALAMAGVFDLALAHLWPEKLKWPPAKWLPALGATAVAIAIARFSIVGFGEYSRFALNVNNPETDYYLPEWGHQVFPEPGSFVAMAVDGNGRDLLFLYMTKQRGLVWCSKNKAYAPRAFWKAQGVRYVAWEDGIDSETRRHRYKVRTLDEDLRLARGMGWSSDVDDAWKAHSMSEWAAIASRTGKDPCLKAEDFDPRKWER
jgi:hypothetical protein